MQVNGRPHFAAIPRRMGGSLMRVYRDTRFAYLGTDNKIERKLVNPAPDLLRIAKNQNAPRETRKSAIFWAGQIGNAGTAREIATLIDDRGLSARIGADQLGHANPSMTADVYMGRKVASTGAALALEALSPS